MCIIEVRNNFKTVRTKQKFPLNFSPKSYLLNISISYFWTEKCIRYADNLSLLFLPIFIVWFICHNIEIIVVSYRWYKLMLRPNAKKFYFLNKNRVEWKSIVVNIVLHMYLLTNPLWNPNMTHRILLLFIDIISTRSTT